MANSGNDAPTRPRIRVDERGQTVWEDTIKMEKLELMSTQRLQAMLAEEHDQHRDAVRAIADSAQDGYLARDMATGHFRVIDDNDLQALLDHEPERGTAAAPAAPPGNAGGSALDSSEELSLVSTQRLRKLLDIPEGGHRAGQAVKKKEEPGGGFNPYDHG